MYEDRVEKAVALFKEGYNCSQSVFTAFADIYGIPQDLALRLSASFGAGIGRMRKTCGAACGMFMLAGLENGSVIGADRLQKGKNYQLVQDLAKEFEEMKGSTTCAEILKLKKGTPIVSTPEARTDEYYAKRPCVHTVETAARIYASFLEKIHNNPDFAAKYK